MFVFTAVSVRSGSVVVPVDDTVAVAAAAAASVVDVKFTRDPTDDVSHVGVFDVF